MTQKSEIWEFYQRVERYLKHMFASKKFKVISYVGDPNKSNKGYGKYARDLEVQLMKQYGMCNKIGRQSTRIDPTTGKATQPDSCYAWYDPSVVSVSATVNGKIHGKMDHRMIRMKYVIRGVKAEMRKFEEFDREVRDKMKTEQMVGDKIDQNLKQWYDKFSQYVFRRGVDGRYNPKSWKEWDVHDRELAINMSKPSNEVVDLAVDELRVIIDLSLIHI